MNSHQLLERAPDGLRREPAPVIRELEPIPASVEPNETFSHEAHYRRLLLLGDVLACSVGVVAASWLGKTTHLTIQSIVLVLLAPAVAKVLGLYDRDQARLRKSTLDELPALLQFAALFSFLALTLASVVFDGILGPREAVELFVVLFAGLMVGRTAARRLAGELTPPERCLFLGPADEAIRFRQKIESDPATNAKLVAQIELHNASPWAAPTVGEQSLADARELVRRLEIQRVIIAPHTSSGGDMLDLMRTFGAIGVRVSVIPAMLQVVGSAVEFDDVHGVAVLGVRSFSLSRSSRLVKRAFDVAGASIVLVLVSPVILITGLMVKLTSHGPVFFRQERVGRGGRSFELLKFRSMVADAEERKAALEEHNQAAEGFFKIADDPRITRVGSVLRRTNLDELPQLLNVLRGEMSLVGPRPLIPTEDQRVVGWHRRRLELTPGMTGHWQVLGSSRVPLDEMVAIDYLYVANWSLWADLKLLLRTIPYVLSRRGL
ncbi:MAG TPA: sugar transferase [Solirubrobacteraceae bacterium]|jgi:exopolysaccharide biosynthesis polyprenyl glycosylphosphotransferase